MKRFPVLLTGLAALLLTGSALYADEEIPAEPEAPVEQETPAAPTELYAPMAPADVKAKVLAWVDSKGIQETPQRKQIAELWADVSALKARDLLELTVQTFALADQPTATLLQSCILIDAPLKAPQELFDNLDHGDTFYSSQVSLYFARYLSQRSMFDEALWIFEDTDAKNVIDPATYFFHRTMCEHQLFLQKEALLSVKTLLENTEDVPTSYSQVATLVKYDLENLKEKSLGHVSHKMNDSKRRLHLARSGQRTQKVQDEIVTLLDEIIEKMEQQMGGGSGDGSQDQESNQNQSSSPANESRVKGNTAPGNVDKKEFQDREVWGKLPEKEETRANNIINKNFPSHYKKVIEEYSKKLAKHKQTSEK